MNGRHVLHTIVALVTASALVGARTAPLAAQGTCEVNNQASCAFGNAAGFAITVTVTAAVGLASSASSVALGTPDGNDFATGFGVGSPLGLTVRANQTWTLTIRSTQATWTAVGTEARLNRPVGDLQWGTLLAGPYTNTTTSAVTLSTGSASAGAAITLYLRGRYSWVLDGPGDYSLPLQLTLTAP